MKRFFRDAILLTFFALIYFYTNAQNVRNQSKELEARIDSLLVEYNNKDIPGLAISIIYNGEIQYKKAYGIANMEYEIQNTTSTKFHVASLAKQFTALSILLLQEKGKRE